jgi:hypothetical protein
LEGSAVAEPFSFDLHMADYSILLATTKYRVRVARGPSRVVALQYFVDVVISAHYQEICKSPSRVPQV